MSEAVWIYFLDIAPALFYSLFKEIRFTSYKAIFMYGIQMIAYSICLQIFSIANDPNIQQIHPWLYGIGLLWVMNAYFRKSSHVVFAFKTIASIQIPILLYNYEIITWDWVVLLVVILLILFHASSEKFRKET